MKIQTKFCFFLSLTILGLLSTLFVITCDIRTHYEKVNGKLMYAEHLFYPGNKTIHFPDETVKLNELSIIPGEGFKAANKDGSTNVEATTGLFLIQSGAFPGFSLVEQDGHYVLFKKGTTKTAFSDSGHCIRLGKWNEYKERN